jgi:hypothetical protein
MALKVSREEGVERTAAGGVEGAGQPSLDFHALGIDDGNVLQTRRVPIGLDGVVGGCFAGKLNVVSGGAGF